MRYQNTLLIAYATLALLVGAVPQGSTSTKLVIKTASGASTALATGNTAAAAGGDGSKNSSDSSVTDSDAETGTNGDTGAASGADTDAGVDSSGADTSSGIGADSNADYSGESAPGASTDADNNAAGAVEDYSSGDSSSGLGDTSSSSSSKSNDDPNNMADDSSGSSVPGDFAGKGDWSSEGNWKTWMAKWMAGQGHPGEGSGSGPTHPHQPRSWNDWWKSSSDDNKPRPNSPPAKRAWRGARSVTADRKWLGPPSDKGYMQGEGNGNGGVTANAHHYAMHQARDTTANSGPSWNDVLNHVAGQQLARRSVTR